MKIDLVYLWVDGADVDWYRKRNSYLPPKEQRDLESFSECRWTNSDELKYSLRSVEKYAPWINHIYIVADGQQPSWLDVENPKISIIDHKDILPNEILPTFNATVIEYGLVNIKGLSEYFLFANDDMFFFQSISPSFFIDNEILNCRFYRNEPTLAGVQGTYATMVLEANSVISKDYPDIAEEINCLFPHHNIDIYSKSIVKEVLHKYQEWVDASIIHRFRSESDLHRHIFSLYTVAIGKGRIVLPPSEQGIINKLLRILKILWKGYDSLYVTPGNLEMYRKVLLTRKISLICINDDEQTTDRGRGTMKLFLESKFANKSSFEL